MHRDSLGTEVPIRPGEINRMTAGRGIVPPNARAPKAPRNGPCTVSRCGGAPSRAEEMAPGFAHHGVEQFPVIRDEGKTHSVVIGSLYGALAGRDRFRMRFSQT